jgi:transcriptional regulator GlxA family with amidase domain
MTTHSDEVESQGALEEPTVFAFLLVPKFSMLAFTSTLEPLRAANNISQKPLFAWRVISRDGRPVAASNDVEVVPNSSIADEEKHAAANLPQTLIVVSGVGAHEFNDRQTMNWLRWMARQGVRIGAVSTASYILARAGLLDGYRCTIHWEALAAFAEDFPELDVTDEVFEIDRNRLTCSGGTASIDMMLSLIALEHGRNLATGVAENFMHERIRDTHDHQRMALRTRLGISHPKLLSVISLMEENLEEPLARAELAERAGLSTRQLERLFRKYLSRTPTRYYLELRLHKARQLLAQTSMSVLDVALACGFVSASHFSKCYREFFDRTPREERSIPA